MPKHFKFVNAAANGVDQAQMDTAKARYKLMMDDVKEIERRSRKKWGKGK